MKVLVLIGRILFSLIFVKAIQFHFSTAGVEHALSKGVPAPNFLVPLAGVMAFIGGLSIACGYMARMGAWLIVLFLLPVTFMMHAFWKETDHMQMAMQMTNFMKNISMLGAAMLITWFGAGPLSIDEWQASKKMQSK